MIWVIYPKRHIMFLVFITKSNPRQITLRHGRTSINGKAIGNLKFRRREKEGARSYPTFIFLSPISGMNIKCLHSPHVRQFLITTYTVWHCIFKTVNHRKTTPFRENKFARIFFEMERLEFQGEW